MFCAVIEYRENKPEAYLEKSNIHFAHGNKASKTFPRLFPYISYTTIINLNNC